MSATSVLLYFYTILVFLFSFPGELSYLHMKKRPALLHLDFHRIFDSFLLAADCFRQFSVKLCNWRIGVNVGIRDKYISPLSTHLCVLFRLWLLLRHSVSHISVNSVEEKDRSKSGPPWTKILASKMLLSAHCSLDNMAVGFVMTVYKAWCKSTCNKCCATCYLYYLPKVDRCVNTLMSKKGGVPL